MKTQDKLPEARQYAPSLLEGEGWGEGFRKRAAFTLSEVLITLGIIGVVAAMTIPTLTHNIQEKQFMVAAKKALSDVNNAYKMMQATDTEFYEIICTRGAYNTCFDNHFGENFKLLAKQFKAVKFCNSDNRSECWNCTGEAGVGSAPNYTGCAYHFNNSFIDTSGRSWLMFKDNEGVFMVDVNGLAKPNQIGKDRWTFRFPNSNVASSNKGMIVPQFSYNVTTQDARWCPSKDCKYGTVFFNK